MTVISFPPETLGDLVLSRILDREAELVALTEAGEPWQEELEELAIVRELLRSIRQSSRLRLH
jgi:hypothetical protein